MSELNPDDKPKPTIDERLAALVQSLELLAAMHKDNEAQQAARDARIAEIEARERKARGALLAGIRAYLEALDED